MAEQLGWGNKLKIVSRFYGRKFRFKAMRQRGCKTHFATRKLTIYLQNIWAASWQNQQRGMWAQRRLRSESSLCAQWVAKDSSFLHADAQADLGLRCAHSIFAGLVMRRLNFQYSQPNSNTPIITSGRSKISKYRFSLKMKTVVICKDLTSLNIKNWHGRFHWTPIWAASSEFGTYRLCEQRRFRRACASAQSRQNLRCSLKQAVSQEEPSDRKPDPWPLWMAEHAQLKFVMTECSKTQIRLMGPNS